MEICAFVDTDTTWAAKWKQQKGSIYFLTHPFNQPQPFNKGGGSRWGGGGGGIAWIFSHIIFLQGDQNFRILFLGIGDNE